MSGTRNPWRPKQVYWQLRSNLLTALRRRKVRMTSLAELPAEEPLVHFPARSIDTADSVSMPFMQIARHLQQPTYAMPPGRSRTLKDVLYCAANNMLLSRERRVIAEASSTERERRWFAPHHVLNPKVEHLDGLCSSIRSLRNNFYHSLVDDLPRLYLLHHPAYADREIRLLFPDGLTRTEAFYLDKLRPGNAEAVIIEKEGLYGCNEFLFPEFLSRRFAGALPPGYLEFFHARVLPDRPRRRNQRILISRRKATNARYIVNEDALSDALAPLGFKPHVLEDLDPQAQIELFYDADAVVAPHGAGLTNLLFAEDAAVLELHPNRELFPHYYFMCRSLGHRYHYWCGTEASRFSPFAVDIPAVLRQLQLAGVD